MNESKVKCELKTSGCNMLQSNKIVALYNFWGVEMLLLFLLQKKARVQW